MRSMLWSKWHWTTEACKREAEKLRATGKYASVRLVDKLHEDGKTFHRIRVYYHV